MPPSPPRHRRRITSLAAVTLVLGLLGRRSLVDRAVEAWLRWRLTMAIRMRELRYSVPAALASSLQPAAAKCCDRYELFFDC